ncbi:hypothetical protein EYZ11_010936 [Aspergillus tanneri]|uniref:FAD-binding 8 domain-containing protein n=1 Tax=Aspergillus tanneri TaxID=1220188 RepID=A0A4S3J4F2_9EURO|nr:hypothetical protein EYZ11_010936 [Aspergillus tanneri]
MNPLMIYTFCFGGTLALLRWISRMGWSELVVQLLYWAGTLACNGVAVKDLSDAGSRAASLALLQFALLLGGSRLHLVADMLGVSLGMLVRIHKTAGWMAALQSGIHIAIVSACLGVLILTSLKPVRQYVYELFIKLHYGLAVCNLVFLWLHVRQVSSTSPFWKPSFTVGCLEVTSILMAATTLWQIGRILCYNFAPGKTLPIARIHQWEQGNKSPDVIKVCVLLPRGWNVRAGQTVYLYLKTMKFWTFPEAHPFSITWWQDPGHMPGIPRPLKDKAPQSTNSSEIGKASKEARYRPLDDRAAEDIRQFGRYEKTTGKETDAAFTEHDDLGSFAIWLLVRPDRGLTGDIASYRSLTELGVIVDGPYGGQQRLDRYGHVVMFAQGIGIAAQMSYIRALFYGSLNGELPTRRICLLWETREKDLIIVQKWMTKLLTEDHDNYNRTLMLDIQLYILDQKDGLRYGRQEVSASEKFADELQRHMLELMDEGFKNDDVELLYLDFQPQQPHKVPPSEGKGAVIVSV